MSESRSRVRSVCPAGTTNDVRGAVIEAWYKLDSAAGDKVLGLVRHNAVLFPTTFWIFQREFSSLRSSSSRTADGSHYSRMSGWFSDFLQFDRGCRSEVDRHIFRCVITPGPIFLQRLHHDPVEFAAEDLL